MDKTRNWALWAALLAAVGCDDDKRSGATCGEGTKNRDGVCVAVGDGDADGDVGDGTNDGADGTGDGGGDGDLTCGAGTVEMEGECVPAQGAEKSFEGFRVTQLQLGTKGRALTGTSTDPTVSTFHPVDVTVAVAYEGDAAAIPLVIALGEEGASADDAGFCLLGGVTVDHPGTGEVAATARLFLPADCLLDNTEDGTGDSETTRVMNPVVMVDPTESLRTSATLPKGIIFSAAAQTEARAAVAAYNAGIQAGETPAAPTPEQQSLATCSNAPDGEAGTCGLSFDVIASDGVDFELTALNLESSVAVLNKCFANQAELDDYASDAVVVDGVPKSMPTGYICNRSIIRGVDAEGEPLPYKDPKDYTYGAADVDVDTTVTAFGLDDSPVQSADELLDMGTETDDGFKLDVDPEDIVNNALGSDQSYRVRYFLRPGSVSLLDATQDASLAAAIARQGGLDELVTDEKLLPIYLHAQGEQAKADEEGVPSGQLPESAEETVSIPQTPTEYNHGLYVENDCGRFNDDRRPDDRNPEVEACNPAVNPRDSLLYGAQRNETEFYVVACLEGVEGALPASDDLDNNCVEEPLRIARVVPREAQWALAHPGSVDPNPFADDPDDVAKPGETRDELFAAGDATDGYAANYDFDQRLGNDKISFNVHAHTYNAVTLQDGVSTDNEARMYLSSTMLDFNLDLVRIWAEAAARSTIVGSYYDYGLEFFGVEYMAERNEVEFHKEWDWNVTKEWEKEKSIWVKVAFIDVGITVEGQLGFKVELDVVARELPGEDEECSLEEDDCECDTPDCSALKTLYPNAEGIGEASIKVGPYGGLEANIYAAVSLLIVRAGAGGELTIAEIGAPATAALNFGFDGDVTAPRNGALNLAAWASLRLESSFLEGRLYLFAEESSIEWCREWWSPPYPCGTRWDKFWDLTLASWDGWSYNQMLYSTPIYRASLTRQGLSTPPPLPQDGRELRLRAKHSGKCADSYVRDLTQYDCHGQAWQRWLLVDEGNGVYRLTNKNTNKCLDVSYSSTNNDAQVWTWPCNGGPNQKVRLEAKGDGWMLKFVHSGKCLQVGGSQMNNDVRLSQGECGGGTNQLWQITPW